MMYHGADPDLQAAQEAAAAQKTAHAATQKLTRHGGRSDSRHWPPTGRLAMTGRGTRLPSLARSRNWASGCTSSGPNCTVANWIRPRSRRWIRPCQAGGRAGSEAKPSGPLASHLADPLEGPCSRTPHPLKRGVKMVADSRVTHAFPNA